MVFACVGTDGEAVGQPAEAVSDSSGFSGLACFEESIRGDTRARVDIEGGDVDYAGWVGGEADELWCGGELEVLGLREGGRGNEAQRTLDCENSTFASGSITPTKASSIRIYPGSVLVTRTFATIEKHTIFPPTMIPEKSR